MIEKDKKILVVGAGGFIGGHLVKKILDNGNSVVASDIKPKEYWFQDFDTVENHYSTDMKDISNCKKVTQGVDYVFNMACNMGGMGFIENNKAECMQSVLINTNLLIACNENKVQRYFFSSSACAYNKTKQQDVFIAGLKEEDAYPADPEDGYGWEKLFSERMCRHFMEDYGIEVTGTVGTDTLIVTGVSTVASLIFSAGTNTNGVSYFDANGQVQSTVSPASGISTSNSILTTNASGVPIWTDTIDCGTF